MNPELTMLQWDIIAIVREGNWPSAKKIREQLEKRHSPEGLSELDEILDIMVGAGWMQQTHTPRGSKVADLNERYFTVTKMALILSLEAV
ncbi:MAG TPA: hypothetical protein VLE47_00280 [Candidatus Saccharimonadales bacterium]|nr:hypothetical protein [Candidatus Saccharimonadales bacterium]